MEKLPRQYARPPYTHHPNLPNVTHGSHNTKKLTFRFTSLSDNVFLITKPVPSPGYQITFNEIPFVNTKVSRPYNLLNYQPTLLRTHLLHSFSSGRKR